MKLITICILIVQALLDIAGASREDWPPIEERPFGWQPPECYKRIHHPDMDYDMDSNMIEFNPGSPFSDEEIQTVMLNYTVPDEPLEIPCTDESHQRMLQGKYVNKKYTTHWPDGRVPYEISEFFNEKQRKMIIDTMKEMENKTCIRYTPKVSADDKWLTIQNGSGCSWGGYHDLIILSVPGCMFPRVIMHELLHAHGLPHEHNRPDRDHYITILWDNMKKSGIRSRTYCKDYKLDTSYPYDYYSVLHNQDYFFAKSPGLKTIDTRGHNINKGRNMSKGDAEKMNDKYNCHKLDCTDGNEMCQDWADNGECDTNPDLMLILCPKACGKCVGGTVTNCKDNNKHCSFWAAEGYCNDDEHKPYMDKGCPKSCNIC